MNYPSRNPLGYNDIRSRPTPPHLKKKKSDIVVELTHIWKHSTEGQRSLIKTAISKNELEFIMKGFVENISLSYLENKLKHIRNIVDTAT